MILDFTTFFKIFIKFIEPDYKPNWYHRLYILELEKFVEDYLAHKRPVLIIETPPQHGKSLINTLFLIWVQAELPNMNLMYSSYSDELVDRASDRIRAIIESDYYVAIYSHKYRRQPNYKRVIISNGSVIQTSIVGGSITGKSIDIGLVDDFHKDPQEARSPTYQKRAREWIGSVWNSRFDDMSGKIYCGTRMHKYDVISYVKERVKDFVLFSFPAIATQDEPFRKEGEALIPEHKSLSFLELCREQMDAYEWASIYQQKPINESGGVVDISYFKLYEEEINFVQTGIFGDTALKTGADNDRSVFLWSGFDNKGNLYIIDGRYGRWNGQELLDNAGRYYDEKRSNPHNHLSGMWIEDAVSGSTIADQLKHKGKAVFKIKPTGSKVDRLIDILPLVEQGRVFLNKNSAFLNDFLREWQDFTFDDSHLHDDFVDAGVMAIATLWKKAKPFAIMNGNWRNK